MSAVPADLRVTSPWRVALPAWLLLVALIGLLYRETAEVMAGIWWESETFAHCMLVLPISLWLVWRQRERLAALAPRPAPWALLGWAVVALAWLLADLVVVNAGAQFAFVAMIVLSVPALLGTEVALAILFPLLFLFFAVPFGEFAVPWMVDWTANFTVTALQLTGIPVYREGQSFIIPSGSWSVVGACSGVRYLMASFMVGTLFAYLNYASYRRRAAFMAISIVVPVVANWCRAYLIVLIGHLSNNRLATGVDHIVYGWVFFGIVVFIMFLIGARWSERGVPLRQSGAGGAARSAPPVSPTSFAVAALAAALITLAPPGLMAAVERHEDGAAPVALALPARFGDAWADRASAAAIWTPHLIAPSAQAFRAYDGPSGSVGVHVAYYRDQSAEAKLVNTATNLVRLSDVDWSFPVDGGVREVALDGRTVAFRRVDIKSRVSLSAAAPRHLIVWHAYWVDGRFVAGDVAAKLAGALARIQGHGNEGASVYLYADAGSPEAGDRLLNDFVQANLGRLGTLLQHAHDAR